MNRLLRSQKGISILQALLFVALVSIASGVLITQVISGLKFTKISKMKTAMTSVEAKIKLAVLSSSSFTCGTNMASCTYAPGFAGQYSENLVGADCAGITPTPAVCGVELQAINFNPVNRMLTGNLVYTGSDINIKPIPLSVRVPEETLQASLQNCPTTPIPPSTVATPFFRGFDPVTGNRICDPIPSGCPNPNEYIAGVDLQNLSPICFSAAGGNTLNCPADQYMSGIHWGIDLIPPHRPVLTATCSPRVRPETIFTPAVGTIPPVTFPPIGAPPPDTIPYTSSTTATSSTTTTTAGCTSSMVGVCPFMLSSTPSAASPSCTAAGGTPSLVGSTCPPGFHQTSIWCNCGASPTSTSSTSSTSTSTSSTTTTTFSGCGWVDTTPPVFLSVVCPGYGGVNGAFYPGHDVVFGTCNTGRNNELQNWGSACYSFGVDAEFHIRCDCAGTTTTSTTTTTVVAGPHPCAPGSCCWMQNQAPTSGLDNSCSNATYPPLYPATACTMADIGTQVSFNSCFAFGVVGTDGYDCVCNVAASALTTDPCLVSPFGTACFCKNTPGAPLNDIYGNPAFNCPGP